MQSFFGAALLRWYKKGIFTKGKKHILPVAALALVLSMGMVACGGNGGEESKPAGDLVIEIKGLSTDTAPNIDFVKLLPAA